MLQEGGLYPGLRPLELLRLFAAYYDDPEIARARCSTSSACATRRARRCGGSRAGRRSGSRSRARSSAGPRSCSSTSRPPGMDPHARATTWELVRDLRDRGVTVLLTTHAMDEAEHSATASRSSPAAGSPRSASPAELTRARGRRRDLVRGRRPASTSTRSPRRSASTVGDVRRGASRASTSSAPPGTPARIADLACFLRDRDVTLAALQAGPPLARRGLPADHRRSGAASTVKRRARSPAQTRAELRAAAAAGREPRSSRSRSRSASSCSSPRSTRSPPTSPTRSTSSCPGVLVARGDGGRDGVARHRDRLRAALRRAEAARLDAAVARRAARRRRPRPCCCSRSCSSCWSSSIGIALGWDVPGGRRPRARPAAARHGRVRRASAC